MPDLVTDEDDAAARSELSAFGGSALGRSAQGEMLSWIPPGTPERDVAGPAAVVHGHHGTEPPSATFDTWAPPHPLALTAGEVDELLGAYAAGAKEWRSEPGRATAFELPFDELPDPERLEGIALAANAAWWRLKLEVLTARLFRYDPGDQHLEHADMHPGSMQRKLSLSIQLSDSDDYAGGDLELRCWAELRTMPRLRGSVVAFPAWIPHRVTPIESGERWSLVLWGWGRPVA